MADVRSLLRNERNARRISHPHVTYSTTGTLVCLICHIQLKSESLWNGHLRSAQHAMRLQRVCDGTLGRPPGAAAPETKPTAEDAHNEDHDSVHVESARIPTRGPSTEKSNKRKADEEEEEPVRKKSRVAGLPEGFFDGITPTDKEASLKTTPPIPGQEFQIASRPATPLKTPEVTIAPKAAAVDEDEWAAFEADIAAAETVPTEAAVISAPAMSAAEVAAKSREEENAQRKERLEAEMEGDKEDAARKLEDEFDEMEALEMRIRKLKEKREALRLNQQNAVGGEHINGSSEAHTPLPVAVGANKDVDEDDEDDEDDDDDWDAFRLKS